MEDGEETGLEEAAEEDEEEEEEEEDEEVAVAVASACDVFGGDVTVCSESSSLITIKSAVLRGRPRLRFWERVVAAETVERRRGVDWEEEGERGTEWVGERGDLRTPTI